MIDWENVRLLPDVHPKWDLRGLERAAKNASYSKDPSSKIGAVLMRPDKTWAGDGYNGFPAGIDDSPQHYLDRDYKIATVIHAEENAILNSRDHSLAGYTMYVAGLPPCCSCASKIIQKGIGRVVAYNRMVPLRWAQNMRWAITNLLQAGVVVDLYDAHLGLFKSVSSPGDLWAEEIDEIEIPKADNDVGLPCGCAA